MIRAPALSWIYWRRPFIQWCMFSFVRNVTVVVLLRKAFSTRFQGDGWLRETVRVWALALGPTLTGHLLGLK